MHFTESSSHITYAFQGESTLHSCLNVNELLVWSRSQIWSLRACNWTRTQNHLVLKRTFKHLVKLAKWFSCVLSTYLYGAFDCIYSSCHVRVSEWIHTPYLPEYKELLAQSRHEIWSLSDCNWTRTQKHLAQKWTLNHLAKLAKWLSCVLSTYPYVAFDCVFFSCYVRVLEWIHIP